MNPSRRAIVSTALDELRQRVREMNDTELIRFGRACAQQLTGDPLDLALVQLEEAQAEWRRRQSSASLC
jgi:hypothetical protein